MNERAKTPEQFMEYFRTNYPGPRTFISNPDWHAPKIYRAALEASAYRDLLIACQALLNFNESLCADVGVSGHYRSAELGRAAIAKAKAEGAL